MTGGWAWRKASGGIWIGDDEAHGYGGDLRIDRVFHAYDVNHNAACEPSCGLIRSAEEPNEGSPLCGQCIAVVKTEPAGREARVRG
jgi:hypothetical protein